jgi:hypothetical protein
MEVGRLATGRTFSHNQNNPLAPAGLLSHAQTLMSPGALAPEDR